MARKIGAIILLTALLVVPFLEWRLGALMWMSAWMIFILQKLFDKKSWKTGNQDSDEEN